MERHGEETHVTTDEARGGSNEGVVRWVLIIGTLLAIVALSAIWITGAATQGNVESQATVSGREDAMESDVGTDSIVSEDADELAAPTEDGTTETPAETIEN